MSAERVVAELRIEARYRRERLARYRRRMAGGRGSSAFKERELQRGCQMAERRLRQADAQP